MPTKDQFRLAVRGEKIGYGHYVILSLENNSSEAVESATVFFHRVNKQNEINSRYDRTTRGIGSGEKVQILKESTMAERFVFERIVLRFHDGSTLELDPPPDVAAGCFVASAVYRGASHPDVVALRAFRDRSLIRTSAGRRFAAWYYRHGPMLARPLERYAILRCAAAIFLVPALKLVLLFSRR